MAEAAAATVTKASPSPTGEIIWQMIMDRISTEETQMSRLETCISVDKAIIAEKETEISSLKTGIAMGIRGVSEMEKEMGVLDVLRRVDPASHGESLKERIMEEIERKWVEMDRHEICISDDRTIIAEKETEISEMKTGIATSIRQVELLKKQLKVLDAPGTRRPVAHIDSAVEPIGYMSDSTDTASAAETADHAIPTSSAAVDRVVKIDYARKQELLRMMNSNRDPTTMTMYEMMTELKQRGKQVGGLQNDVLVRLQKARREDVRCGY
jgi:hypothetical protein